MDEVLIISTSLNQNSKSRLLAGAAFEAMSQQVESRLIDLAEYNLPICDGDSVYGNEDVKSLTKLIKDSKAIVLAVPVYNYAAGASVKNLIELTGEAWEDKTVAFLCAAGGKSSYMSIMGLANSLMLDFRCVIVPRFVYADSASFGSKGLEDETIRTRIHQMAESLSKLAGLRE